MRFRFGVQCIHLPDREGWPDVARRIEDRGFDVLNVCDHLVDGCVAPFTALAVAAAATSTVRLSPLVLNNDLRHPAVVAQEILTLDALSEGRVEVGLGAGHGFPEYESTGIPFDDGRTRVARLREALEILDSLLRGDETSFTGDHYRIDAHRAWPAPVQSPRPPILVGGNGRQLLRLAGERADIIGVTGAGKTKADGLTHDARGFAPEAVDERIALVRAAAAGRSIELHALIQTVIVTDDPRGAAERVARRVPELTIDEILTTPYLWIGSVESICEHIVAARELALTLVAAVEGGFMLSRAAQSPEPMRAVARSMRRLVEDALVPGRLGC
jgi:probable F420-dependent oxidoreductase